MTSIPTVTDAAPVGRFAPSPSGRMHLGNVLAALIAWCEVRSRGGTMLLRSEDLDPERCSRAYYEQIKDDLLWLGLDWDEESPAQSTRSAAYAREFEKLEALGLIYPCYCSRSEVHAASAPHASDGTYVYSGKCRELTPAQRAAQKRRPAWRVRVPDERFVIEDGIQGRYEENLLYDCGDFVVRRADGVYAYQLAVVTDDAQSGVTQVVRGQDLLSSSPRQAYLYRTLGYPVPEFCHIPLLYAPDGSRLSKRDRALDLGVLRQRFRPEQLLGLLASAAGLTKAALPVSAGELAAGFSRETLAGKQAVYLPAELME